MNERVRIGSIIDGYSDIDLPLELRDSVARHQRNLAALVMSLRSAGLDETLIEASVHQLVSSYEAELKTALKALVTAPDHV